MRNRERIEQIFNEMRPDVVYHAAAYKHVPLMESYPNEAIQANVLGTKNMAASVRRSGIVLHGILAGVRKPEDLPGAVQEAVLDGRIDSTHAAEALQLLGTRIAAHPEFFGGGGWNEAAIFDADGSEYRPDRVVVRGDSALVVDYKFGGHEKRYANQVRRYMRLCSALGFKEVKGCVWYVPEDEIDYICSL